MTELSRPWAGSITGDAGSYTDQHWRRIWQSLFSRNGANKGVLRGVRNELAVSGATSPVSVATGGAIVQGAWYDNDGVVTVAIPTPAGATRIDLIVLRMSWTAQTVRITRVAGAEGGAAPALTQVDGTTWDIPLAQCSITTGAAITVTNAREFVRFGTSLHLLGEVIEWYSNTLPDTNYVWANGQAISRTDYADLFALWGTTFGVGDGSTTFNVVDKRGRGAAGKDDMGGAGAAGRLTTAGSGVDGATLGASGGAQTHTLVTNEMPAHSHPNGFIYSTGSVGVSGSNSTLTNTGNTGGGAAHNNTQPTIISNFIICAR